MLRTTTLPDSARLALWLTALLGDVASPDETLDQVLAGDTAHHVAGLPGEDGPVPLMLAFGALRRTGATGAGLALPVPGDPLGLAGPPELNAAALEVEEAVVLVGSDLGMVPHRAGSGVVWTCLPAQSRRQVPDIPEAATTLRRTLLDTANRLADLDVARWRPDVADALMALRHGPHLDLPPGLPPGAAALLGQAVQCQAIVDLAREDDGGAVSAAEAAPVRAASPSVPPVPRVPAILLTHKPGNGTASAADHDFRRF